MGTNVSIKPNAELRNGIYILNIEQNQQITRHKIIIY